MTLIGLLLWLSHLVHVMQIIETHIILPNFKTSDTKFMNTCSFTINFKNISAYSKMFVECIFS